MDAIFITIIGCAFIAAPFLIMFALVRWMWRVDEQINMLHEANRININISAQIADLTNLVRAGVKIIPPKIRIDAGRKSS